MNWSGRLPELMEHLGRLGVTFIVKFDGERLLAGGGPWTVLASGGPLAVADGPVRCDGRDLERCLSTVVAGIRSRLGPDAVPQ
ncbi:hypothetical protein R8Z50_29965 [Longispora sp. K20-0274]|uniref:hypothetical protein n=1 Tax=Longispora sp. K20-0274 TaxID=3088255 RepID=UPI00399B2E9A